MFNWEAFHFLRPEWLLLFIPFTAIIYITYKKEYDRNQWENIISPHIVQYLKINKSEYRRFNPVVISAVGLAIMIVLLAGPTWSRQTTPLSQDASSLVIILDASSSMAQSDIQPSRLQRSKQKIEDLLNLRTGKNTALIVFGGSAHTVLPLTNDKDILINYLQAITTDIIPLAGKFPEKALPNIASLGAHPDAPMTVLWIGDGYGDQTSASFEEYFNSHQQQLLILGIGKDPQKLSPEEKLQVVPLASTGLKSIATQAGGRYIEATADTADVKQINRYIQHFYINLDDEYSPWLDQGYYLLFPLMALFILWFRPGWTLQWGLIICTGLSALGSEQAYAHDNRFIDLWLTPNQQGHWHYHNNEYIDAAEHFQDSLWKGMAYYQAEEFLLAAEYFSRSNSEQGLFYMGNALAHAEKYLKAISIYDQLLQNNPAHVKAQHNRQLLQDIVDEINLMSESQQPEMNEMGKAKEFSDEASERADGATFKTFEKTEIKQYTADEILQDQTLQDMWMRSVQPDPSRFLSSKFSMQNNLLKNSDTTPQDAGKQVKP